MGFETVKTKDGKLKLWKTIVDKFEGEFDSCIQLLGYLEKKHKTKYTKGETMQWMDGCDQSPTEDEFMKGLITIPVDAWKKMVEKKNT